MGYTEIRGFKALHFTCEHQNLLKEKDIIYVWLNEATVGPSKYRVYHRLSIQFHQYLITPILC